MSSHLIHGAIVSIQVAINNTNNTDVDIKTGSFIFVFLQLTDVLSANAYWLLTTWWSKQGLYNAGKLSTRSVYYSLPFILHQKDFFRPVQACIYWAGVEFKCSVRFLINLSYNPPIPLIAYSSGWTIWWYRWKPLD